MANSAVGDRSSVFTALKLTKTRLKTFIGDERMRLITVCIAVFVLGLAAHAYGFLNLTIGHDSLNAFIISKMEIVHRIKIGRFVTPIYKIIFHDGLTSPWLSGLLSLCWLSITVWLTAVIFSISKKTQLVLLAGIYSTNITVTALTATYMHDLDADLFAVMLAVCAVFLWHRGRKIAWLGIPLLVMLLGLYQSMLSVTITLIMFSSIIALLQGDDAAKVVKKGLQAIAIILIAGIIYLFFVKLLCRSYGISLSNDYNGLSKLFESKGNLSQFAKLIVDSYKHWFCILFIPSRWAYGTGMLFLHIVLFISTIIAILHAMSSKVLAMSNKIVVLLLCVLLPLGMNISFVADSGMLHYLMIYAIWLIYLLPIIITDWYAVSNLTNSRLPEFCKGVTVIALGIILFSNIQMANMAYVKKQLERQATLSIMTTVNAQMNQTAGYVAGKTEVVFIGSPKTGAQGMPNYLSYIIGLNFRTPITYVGVYNAYYKYVLQSPLRWQRTTTVPVEFTKLMPSYPKAGYIQWYNDLLVVKLSDDSVFDNCPIWISF